MSASHFSTTVSAGSFGTLLESSYLEASSVGWLEGGTNGDCWIVGVHPVLFCSIRFQFVPLGSITFH